jgi:hypothetical protein
MLCVATAVCLLLLSVLSFTSARCVRMESVRVWRYFIAVPCVVTLIVLSRHCPAMARIAFSADVWFSMQSTMRDARVVTVYSLHFCYLFCSSVQGFPYSGKLLPIIHVLH